ncbi:MAG: PaaI family thioesterase [Flavobacteriales bacterium]|jgi:uncharacterized protein (TIGR00369 family)
MFNNPIEIYKSINRFAQDNGMTLDVKTPGESTYNMTVLDKHLSSPNVCHGGVVAGFMDSVLGSAALSISFSSGALVSTVEFKINYFLPVFLSDELEGIGKVDFEGKKLISSTGEIFRTSNGKRELIAKAIGTFNKYPIEKTQFAELFNN